MKIAVGSDHRGFKLKNLISDHLRKSGYHITDVGCFNEDSANHIEYGIKVGELVAKEICTYGIVICGSGIGISIAANKVKGVRCALVRSEKEAITTRAHNNANVLAMSETVGDDQTVLAIVDAFITSPFLGDKYQERIAVLDRYEKKEKKRQADNLELIASENYTSAAIMEACGSILTNKYAEGYPGKRYYGGCEYVDMVESYGIELVKKLFDAEHANIQPHSGSQANMAVYLAVLKPGDIVLGMDLSSGGHLTHGHPLNFSGLSYNFIPYSVDKNSECLDYDIIRALAHKHKPKMIVAGASSYSRIINFATLRQIADEVSAYLFVDMAHIAGLVAAKLHPSPVPYADFVTSTTHKTLRGPRGGFILCKEKYRSIIDRALFPGTQGGPLMHIIAGKALCFEEALTPEFAVYQNQVIKNAKALMNSLKEEGFRVVSNDTDNHLFMIDVFHTAKLTGSEAEKILDSAYITCNKNAIPFDTLPPNKASGIRLGSPALTTRGLKEDDFVLIGKIIADLLKNPQDKKVLSKYRKAVRGITKKFPWPLKQ
ncbi:serine hydroxymethyltransferase [Holotrichia oblita]|nr:serine hydroxymethyltransferase [Holotrichia oblita]